MDERNEWPAGRGAGHAAPMRRAASWLGDGARRLFGDFDIMDALLFIMLVGMPLPLNLALGGVDAMHVGAVQSATGGGVYALGMFLLRGYRRRRKIRRDGTRRIGALIDRIRALVDTVPRKTEAETLATIHEMRNCYDEAIELIERTGDGNTDLADSMREGLERVVELYGIQTESLRRTEANAADFAAAMRRLGRDADGSPR